MKHYYVNNKVQLSGDYEVHKEGCRYMPSDNKSLGKHSNCKDAVAEAKKIYSTANGCKTCCYPCHTS